jgi:hypothetical protein
MMPGGGGEGEELSRAYVMFNVFNGRSTYNVGLPE